jgi:hypothetical protein
MIMIENYFINLNPIFKYTILFITLYESFRKTSSIDGSLPASASNLKMSMGIIPTGFTYLNPYPTGQISTHTWPHTHPRVGDRYRTHTRVGKWVPADSPYSHVLLKT